MLLINLILLKLSKSPFQADPQLSNGDGATKRTPKTSSKGGTEVLPGTILHLRQSQIITSNFLVDSIWRSRTWAELLGDIDHSGRIIFCYFLVFSIKLVLHLPFSRLETRRRSMQEMLKRALPIPLARELVMAIKRSMVGF